MKGGNKRPVRPNRKSTHILLVEPEFPLPTKSKNHSNFLPIGLLKIGAWLEDEGFEVELARGKKPEDSLEFKPDEVWITSLFTYWSKYVIDTAKHYKSFSNKPRIVIGGIYASLMEEHCKKHTGCNVVFKGVHSIAEQYYPAYRLLGNDLDYQIVHASRGCIHKCKFCGVHIIEPGGLKSERSILPLIAKPKKGSKKICEIDFKSNDYVIEKKNLVFYDNNLLANENIESILEELALLKKKRKIGWCESQSGFDGRVMQKKPHIARMLKEAGFKNPRIAWDWGLNQGVSIKIQVDLLVDAGYASKNIYVFMLYNWGIPFEEMEQKRIQCFEWGVQIADCRFRPLTQTFDEYRPSSKKQCGSYYIHEKKGWTDALVKQFRRNVRRQNICVRHAFPLYSRAFETKKASPEEMRMVKRAETFEEKILTMRILKYDTWNPTEITLPDDYDDATSLSLQTVLREHT